MLVEPENLTSTFNHPVIILRERVCEPLQNPAGSSFECQYFLIAILNLYLDFRDHYKCWFGRIKTKAWEICQT